MQKVVLRIGLSYKAQAQEFYQENPGGMESSSEKDSLSRVEISTYNDRVRRGFFWIFSTTILWQMASWLCTVLTVRILKPEDYGLVALPDAVFPYLTMLATLKLDTWMTQERELDETKEATVLSLLLLLAGVSTVAGLYAAPILSKFYGYPELEPLAQAMCLTFFPRALRIIPETRLRKELLFKQIALSNLSVGVVRGILQVYLAHQGYGAWTLIWGAIFSEVAMLVWLSLVAGMPKKLRFDLETLNLAGRFGISATVSTVFWVIFSTADNLVVGKLFGKEALGFYATAFLLTDMPLSKINTVLAPLILPYYSKLKQNQGELLGVFARVNKSLVSIIAPVLVGMAIVAEEFVPLIFGEHWRPMILPLQVMCVVGILRALTSNVSSLLFAINQPQRVLRCSAIAASVLPLAFWFLGSKWGMLGIYMSWLLVYPLVGPWLLFRQIADVAKVSALTFWKNFRTPFVAAFFLALVTGGAGIGLAGFIEQPVLIMGSKIVLGILLYFLIYRFCFTSDYFEALDILKGLRGKKN